MEAKVVWEFRNKRGMFEFLNTGCWYNVFFSNWYLGSPGFWGAISRFTHKNLSNLIISLCKIRGYK